MLHVGTLAAIVIYYRAVIKTGAAGLLGSTEVPPAYRRAAVIRVGLLAVVATLPLIPLKLFLKDLIDQTFESAAAAGIGFLITAAVLSLNGPAERRGQRPPGDDMARRPPDRDRADVRALPGVSRSGLTVARPWRWGCREAGPWGSAC